jgi:hypothetical protein
VRPDPRPIRRAFCAAGVVLFAVCVLGCMAAPFKARAVYGPELEFRAYAQRDAFDEMTWSDIQKRRPVCPVTVHLPGVDVGDEQLRSAKAMTDLGGQADVNDVGQGKDKMRVTVVTLDRGGAKVTAFYHDERLVSVQVRVTEPTALTFDGKRVTLPLSRSDLIGTFGPPAQMIE